MQNRRDFYPRYSGFFRNFLNYGIYRNIGIFFRGMGYPDKKPPLISLAESYKKITTTNYHKIRLSIIKIFVNLSNSAIYSYQKILKVFLCFVLRVI